MDLPNDFDDLHAQVRVIKAQTPPEFRMDEQLVFEILMEVESIRRAVRMLMGIRGAEFAAAMLLCILSDAQEVALMRQLSDETHDALLFDDCVDDAYLHSQLRNWLLAPSK